MKKTLFVIGLILILSMFTASALISSVSITTPPAGTETNDATMNFDVAVVWTAPTNITNVSIYIDGSKVGTNGTINGSRDSPTTGSFAIKGISLSSYSSGSHTIIAEARNDSEISTTSAGLNSSSRTFIIDSTAPTVILALDREIVAPLKVVTLDCSRNRGTTDTNTINNSAWNLYVIDPDGTRTTNTPTTGYYEFSGETFTIKGEYTAGCNATDNAGNTGVASTVSLRVSSDDNEVAKGEAQAKSFKRPMNRNIFIFGGLFIMVCLVVLVLFLISASKK